jgi:hypothetical protein
MSLPQVSRTIAPAPITPIAADMANVSVRSPRGPAQPRGTVGLARPPAGQHDVDGLQEDAQVEAQAPVLDVLTVKPDHVVET